MKLFGITGGIGMGKSTAGGLLLKQGYPVLDTDVIAREIVQPNRPALREIQRTFGDRVVAPSGELNRDELARIVFANASERQKLEAILHPRIRGTWQTTVATWRNENQPVGFVIIPLLFETDAAHFFDSILCVACSSRTQFKRLQSRNWGSEVIQQRIAAQWPVDKKIAASDYVIWTDSPLEIHAAQLVCFLSSAA